MNYEPITWLTWFGWGFFMSIGWVCGKALIEWVGTEARLLFSAFNFDYVRDRFR